MITAVTDLNEYQRFEQKPFVREETCPEHVSFLTKNLCSKGLVDHPVFLRTWNPNWPSKLPLSQNPRFAPEPFSTTLDRLPDYLWIKEDLWLSSVWGCRHIAVTNLTRIKNHGEKIQHQGRVVKLLKSYYICQCSIKDTWNEI